MFQVVDAAGNVFELEDGTVVPDGYTLRTPLELLDSVQQAVARSWRDAEPENGKLSDTDQAEQRRADAYSAFKQGLHTAPERRSASVCRRIQVGCRRCRGSRVGGTAMTQRRTRQHCLHMLIRVTPVRSHTSGGRSICVTLTNGHGESRLAHGRPRVRARSSPPGPRAPAA